MLQDRGAAGVENTALYEDPPPLEAAGGARRSSISSLKFRECRRDLNSTLIVIKDLKTLFDIILSFVVPKYTILVLKSVLVFASLSLTWHRSCQLLKGDFGINFGIRAAKILNQVCNLVIRFPSQDPSPPNQIGWS